MVSIDEPLGHEFWDAWTWWPSTQHEITSQTHLKPSIQSDSQKKSKICTSYLR